MLLKTKQIKNVFIMKNLNINKLFFLLLLTRAYIPKDVQTVIEGSDFASYIYEYFSIYKLSIYPSFLKNFEFELTNKSLEPLGINYDSTLANISSFLVCTFFMILISFMICFIRKIAFKWRGSQRCSRGAKAQYCRYRIELLNLSYNYNGCMILHSFLRVIQQTACYLLND